MLVREFADLLESIEDSLADGRVEAVEAEHVRREWEELKSAGEALVVSCEHRAGRKALNSPGRGTSRRKSPRGR